MQKLPILALGLAFPAFVFCFCNAQKPAANPAPNVAIVADSLPYDLANPVLILNLADDALMEISGLSPTPNAGQFVAIADEGGELFFLDANKGGVVTKRLIFREKGDFEGVEMVGNTIWAIKSDGDLFSISAWDQPAPTIESFKTPLKKTDDVEGLGYDPSRNALIMACKGDADVFTPRNLYAFDLKTRQMSETPVYSIDPEEVNKFVPYLDTEKQDAFSPSGVALHPISNDVYVISTALKRLVILDYASGKIKYAQRLDKKNLPQPEGISFDAEGNLFISSEGKGGDGLLLQYKLKSNKN
jgi:uncharacterized protein YjiK